MTDKPTLDQERPVVARFEVRRLVRQHEKSGNWWKDLLRLAFPSF